MIRVLLFAIAIALTANAKAYQWMDGVTVIAVNATSTGVAIKLAEPTTCFLNTIRAIKDQMNQTDASISRIHANVLMAVALGWRIQVGFNDSTISCYVDQIYIEPQ